MPCILVRAPHQICTKEKDEFTLEKQVHVSQWSSNASKNVRQRVREHVRHRHISPSAHQMQAVHQTHSTQKQEPTKTKTKSHNRESYFTLSRTAKASLWIQTFIPCPRHHLNPPRNRGLLILSPKAGNKGFAPRETGGPIAAFSLVHPRSPGKNNGQNSITLQCTLMTTRKFTKKKIPSREVGEH